MFERFTDKARRVVVHAQEVARDRGAESIRTEHLLASLFAVPDNLAVTVLAAQHVTQADVEADIDRMRGAGPTPSDSEALATLGIDLDEVRRQVEDAFGPGALDRWDPARPDLEEGSAAGPAGGVGARAQLHRHRAPPAGADPRGRWRGPSDPRRPRGAPEAGQGRRGGAGAGEARGLGPVPRIQPACAARSTPWPSAWPRRRVGGSRCRCTVARANGGKPQVMRKCPVAAARAPNGRPAPPAVPTAATGHTVAAVVSPRTMS